jgi:hypothetical protein
MSLRQSVHFLPIKFARGIARVVFIATPVNALVAQFQSEKLTREWNAE